MSLPLCYDYPAPGSTFLADRTTFVKYFSWHEMTWKQLKIRHLSDFKLLRLIGTRICRHTK